jgi:hypothetical protein
MLDIPIESSQSDDQRTFVANVKRIPPLGTPVRLVLKVEEEGGKRKAESRKQKAESRKRKAESGKRKVKSEK